MKHGCVAIVTGGASGIGLATARRLAQEGARVAVVDRADPEEAARAIVDGRRRAPGASGRTWPTRRGSRDGGRGAVARAARGRARQRGGDRIPSARHDRRGHDGGMARPLRSEPDRHLPLLPGGDPTMRRGGGGTIVNIASELGLVGAPRSAMYGATKGAVVQLTRALAVDHAPDHIRVELRLPGAGRHAAPPWRGRARGRPRGQAPRRDELDPAGAARPAGGDRERDPLPRVGRGVVHDGRDRRRRRRRDGPLGGRACRPP